MLGILNFLLIQLDFESYFIKLLCIQDHVLLNSGAQLAPRLLEACTLVHFVSFKTMKHMNLRCKRLGYTGYFKERHDYTNKTVQKKSMTR